ARAGTARLLAVAAARFGGRVRAARAHPAGTKKVRLRAGGLATTSGRLVAYAVGERGTAVRLAGRRLSATRLGRGALDAVEVEPDGSAPAARWSARGDAL